MRGWSDEKGKLYTDYLISTLANLSTDEIAKLYDGRAGGRHEGGQEGARDSEEEEKELP